MFQRDDLNFRRVGHIHRCNDLRQATQVVGVVGDHQRVVARVDIDGVVRADQRPEHRHQVIGRFKIEFEDLGKDLAACGQLTGISDGNAATLQFGIGFRHYFVHSASIHQRRALQTKRCQKLVVGR